MLALATNYFFLMFTFLILNSSIDFEKPLLPNVNSEPITTPVIKVKTKMLKPSQGSFISYIEDKDWQSKKIQIDITKRLRIWFILETEKGYALVKSQNLNCFLSNIVLYRGP
jgi:hypothetical protein